MAGEWQQVIASVVVDQFSGPSRHSETVQRVMSDSTVFRDEPDHARGDLVSRGRYDVQHTSTTSDCAGSDRETICGEGRRLVRKSGCREP